jgi:hypothetical protein
MSNIEQVIIRTPQQQGFRNPQVISNIRELREWLDTLPLLKPVPTVRQLTDAIDALNRQQLNQKKRQQLLHEYRQVILQINPSLNLNALKRLSLTEKEREQLQLQSTALCMALADGYKIILKQALEEGIAHKPGVMFEPLYLALEALSLALLNCFRAYKTAPQNLYQDIHQLYLLAEHSGILELEIEPEKLSLSAVNIGNLYKQTMILAFLDPYHLPSGVVEKLYERLSRLSAHCNLLDTLPAADAESVFITDLTSDAAPRAIFKVPQPDALKLPRVFELQAMTNKIQAEITSLQTQESGLSVNNETELLKRLIPVDKAQLTRKAERINSNRICKVTFGIDAVHYFLNISKTELEQVLNSTADRFGPHLLESWVVTNESQTGLSLNSEQITRHDVSVGDIIGLLTEETGEQGKKGTIAIIRWIRNDKDNNINIGIEFISGNLLPAMCRLIDGPNTNNICAAIFISSMALNDMPATLITPKKVYQRGRIMEVTIGDQPLRIKAGYLRDDTFTFDRFDFTSLNT